MSASPSMLTFWETFSGGEDPLYLGGGTGQTVVVGVLVAKVCKSQETDRVVRQCFADFVGGQTGGVDIAVHGDEAGQSDGHGDDLFIQAGGDIELAIPVIVHRQDVGDVGNLQIFCHFRTHLGGIAVGGLFAADDQIKLAALADTLGQGVGRGQHVRTGKFPVCQHGAGPDTHADRFLDDGFGLGRPHGNGLHAAAEPLCQRQGSFDAVQVIGVDFAGNTASLQNTGDRIHFHVVGAGHLLDTYQNFHL